MYKLLTIISFLLIGCNKKKVQSNFSYLSNCNKVTAFSFPNLYIYQEEQFKKVLEFENFVEILGITKDFIFLNEVVKPYKENRIHIYQISKKLNFNKTIKNIDCVLNGGRLFSYKIYENNQYILFEIDCDNKKTFCFNKSKFKEINIKNIKNIKPIKNDCENIKFSYKKTKENHLIKIKNIISEIPIQYIYPIDEN